MGSKSDSAGKLHQYYTAIYLKEKSNKATVSSPLDDIAHRSSHFNKFSSKPEDIKPLKKIGLLSADLIQKIVDDDIIHIDDIGVGSGASSHDITDDLVIKTKNKGEIGFSLKCSKNIGQILSKNMGAKSLLEQYFGAPNEQIQFNTYLDAAHLEFLNKALLNPLDTIPTAKKAIKKDVKSNKRDKARFADKNYFHMNEARTKFLEGLRDKLFTLLNNLKNAQLAKACNLILDTGKNHILAEYKVNEEKVEYISINKKNESDIQSIHKRGNDSVVINSGDYSIGFRFKFESGITSSIKLVGDYKKN
ncbi:MAG: hypothetical protein JJ958_09335 [Balneola sp.]|nr:hypothetical protein [Balneola sp.]